MGYDFLEVKDLIEDVGVPVLSEQLVVDALAKQDQYRNPLLMPSDGEVGFQVMSPQSNTQMAQLLPRNGRQGNRVGPAPGGNIPNDPDDQRCKVCLVTNIDTVCVPCGHRCLCHGCSLDLRDKTCPICR